MRPSCVKSCASPAFVKPKRSRVNHTDGLFIGKNDEWEAVLPEPSPQLDAIVAEWEAFLPHARELLRELVLLRRDAERRETLVRRRVLRDHHLRELARRPALVVQPLGLDELADQPHDVVGVEDGEVGFEPGEFGVATDSLVIAAVEVTTSGSDAGQITPLNDQIHDRHGIYPKETLTDGGFVNLEDIEAETLRRTMSN